MPTKQTISTDTMRDIRNSIVRSSSLLKEGVPISLDEKTVNSTNCYAYAMGIMYNILTKPRGFYNPGFTENESFKLIDTPEILINRVKHDLDNIGIKYREVISEKKGELKENEYLVKIFMADPNEEIPRGDFHFVRQDRKTGKWFHKLGWDRQPEITQSAPECDDDYILGSEPEDITICCNNNFSYTYYEAGYLAIEEP